MGDSPSEHYSVQQCNVPRAGSRRKGRLRHITYNNDNSQCSNSTNTTPNTHTDNTNDGNNDNTDNDSPTLMEIPCASLRNLPSSQR